MCIIASSQLPSSALHQRLLHTFLCIICPAWNARNTCASLSGSSSASPFTAQAAEAEVVDSLDMDEADDLLEEEFEGEKRARSLSSIFTAEDDVLEVDAAQADESLAVFSASFSAHHFRHCTLRCQLQCPD